ncbi:acyl-CoA thioesterase [Cognatishimia sp.]|uniref:acyl-CoA thioesterase n=2 Tax=Cognatishimia sp. TaxID=2211648 RepID=UPI003512A4C6
MYPWIRLISQYRSASRMSKIAWHDTHISHTRCWPWDLDPWNELNNGRALTFFDLGRVGWTARMDVADVMREHQWGMAVAGSTVRYRRRVKLFNRLEMRTRIVGWDDKFFYYEQSTWKRDGECAYHAVIRAALTSRAGLVPPAKLVNALDRGIVQPEMPKWIQQWAKAEELRPWPPMSDDVTPNALEAA